MNNTYFNLKVNSIPAGQFFKMAYVSDVTLSALGRKAGVSVLKRVIGTYRIGVNYKHTKKAIAKAAEKNIPIDTASKLPWGQWKDNSNRIICHTNKKGEYNEYLRVYDTPNKPKVQHYLNGKPISKEDLRKTGFVPDSYFTSKNDSGCMTISANNIEWIGQPSI